MAAFFSTQLGKIVITFFISMLPVLECRMAIPTGVAYGLPTPVVIAVAIIGNLLPVPFIIIFIERIFKWLRQKSKWIEKHVDKLEARAAKKADKVEKSMFWGLLLFVAIPLPGTGAWTGSLIAAFLGMKPKQAMPAIATGVCIAAALITALSLGTKVVINLF